MFSETILHFLFSSYQACFSIFLLLRIKKIFLKMINKQAINEKISISKKKGSYIHGCFS